MFRASASPIDRARPGLALFLFGLLLLRLSPVVEAVKAETFKNICRGLWCFSSEDNGRPVVSAPLGPAPVQLTTLASPQSQYDPDNEDDGKIECLNPNAPRRSGDWPIAKLEQMPTVAQLAADLRLCGIANGDGVNAFFSSFGGKANDRITYKDSAEAKAAKLNLKHITDLMPDHFTHVALKFGCQDSNGPELKLWNMRLSQAFATVVAGDVYVVTSGTKPGDYDTRLRAQLGEFHPANIYSVPFVNQDAPWMGAHNVWYDQEFHTLQKNPRVTAIYTVLNTNLKNAIKRGDGAWVRSPRSGGDAPFFLDADSVTVSGLARLKQKFDALPGGDQTALKNAKVCPASLGLGLESLGRHEKRARTQTCNLVGKPTKTNTKKPGKTDKKKPGKTDKKKPGKAGTKKKPGNADKKKHGKTTTKKPGQTTTKKQTGKVGKKHGKTSPKKQSNRKSAAVTKP